MAKTKTPKPSWTGTLSFGLVNIPMALSVAADEANPGFNQLNSDTGNRIGYKRVDKETGAEVSYDQVVRGYEVEKNRYVVISDEELDAIKPRSNKVIDVIATVPRSAIDPRLVENSYHVMVTNEGAAKGYKALTEALSRTGRVAIGTYAARTVERVVAFVPHEGQLLCQHLRYTEQLRDLPAASDVDVPKAYVDAAIQVVESFADDNALTGLTNTYGHKVADLVAAKVAGEQITITEDLPDPEPTIDLLAALAASVEAAKKRNATGTDGS